MPVHCLIFLQKLYGCFSQSLRLATVLYPNRNPDKMGFAEARVRKCHFN